MGHRSTRPRTGADTGGGGGNTKSLTLTLLQPACFGDDLCRGLTLDAPADIDQPARARGGEHVVTEICDLRVEIRVAQRTLDAPDGVLDEGFDPLAVLQRDRDPRLRFADG